MLNKWQDAGFERELRKLVMILESGSAAEANQLVCVIFVCKVQYGIDIYLCNKLVYLP